MEPAPSHSEDLCHETNANCDNLRCQYEIDTSYNERGCKVCTCDHPCRDKECPEGSVCAVHIESDAESGTRFVAVCRESVKPGECPALGNSSSCGRECYSDADCHGEKKCCTAGCGSVCALPHVPDSRPAQPPHARPPPPEYHPDSFAPVLQELMPAEVNVQSSEGGFAVLRCFATGYPPPTVTWQRHGIVLNTNQGRFAISSDGDLQIVQLHRTDSGIYVCIADNGLGEPVHREVELAVDGKFGLVLFLVAVARSWYQIYG